LINGCQLVNDKFGLSGKIVDLMLIYDFVKFV